MRALLLLAALLLAGCTGPTQAPGPGTGRALTFQAIEGCTGQQATERNQVIDTQAAWEQLWRSACQGDPLEATPAPAVDFQRRSVVASFWGEQRRGGYAVQVLNITDLPDQVRIDVERARPGPTCFTIEAITYPSAIVHVEKLSKAARFSFQDVVRDC